MNSVAYNWASINLSSMIWTLVVSVLATGTLGCQNTPTLDPFMARAVVAPPATGSFTPPTGSPPPYYNPPPAATPSPGPGTSGMVSPLSPILTASTNGNTTASAVQQTSAESSVLLGPTAPVAVVSVAPAEAPLRIVENEIPSAIPSTLRPAGSAQSFGPGEPARFQPSGPVVSLKTKRADDPLSTDVSPVNVSPVTGNSASGSLHWKPSR